MAHMIVTVKKLNRRSGPIANVADKSNVIDIVTKGFSFDSIAEINNAAGTWYKDDAQLYYWGGGLMVDITSVSITPVAKPVITLSHPSVSITEKTLLNAPASVPAEMPLNYNDCIKCAGWVQENFADKIAAVIENTPFDSLLVHAITCQETAQRWSLWIKDYDAATILQRSVFDASGDIAGTNRSAFPRNKAEMLAHYGQGLTQMLIDEANKMRAMPQPGHPGGFQSADYLYKGYGMFQYDLQNIQTDADFFENKLWYSIDACVDRLLKELNEKWRTNTNNMYATVRAYNGSGPRAEQYAQNVSQFYTWIKAM